VARIAIGAPRASLSWYGASVSLSFLLASCSSANEAAPGSGSGASSTVIGCANDPRADTYGANMSKVGSAKALTFVLVSASPAPPAINDNTWTLKVLDASGNPLPNATFSAIKTWMPDHGHGAPETPMATANADGTYTVQPLDLFMNGLWQITFTAQAGAVSDSATFSFCIGG
jgi:YtkA-like protein